MNKEEILSKVKSDPDYIPTLDEYRLIAGTDFEIGYAPIFTLSLWNDGDRSKMEEIQRETKEARLDGLTGLYGELSLHGYCETYKEERLYYLAYTLAQKNINFSISGIDYKMKLEKKLIALRELKKQIES